MDKQRRQDAIDYITSCLEDGYLDLGLHDQDEMEVVKEAMKLLKWMDNQPAFIIEYDIVDLLNEYHDSGCRAGFSRAKKVYNIKD